MGIFDHITQLLGKDGSTKASITSRGTKGAVAVELVDASGNQVSSFGDATAANQALQLAREIAIANSTDSIDNKLSSGVAASGESSVVYSNGAAKTPLFAKIDAAGNGDNTIVPAAGGKIRVLALFMVATAAVNVRFESGASGTALTGQMNLTTNSGFVLPYNPVGWFETDSSALLNLELSGAVSVDGSLTYIIV
jgi:hypothetical protein